MLVTKTSSDSRAHAPLGPLSLDMPVLVLIGLGASIVALALAPAFIPESYSWVSHTTSESAAQGVHGAWLARAGLLLFGLSVLGLAAVARSAWGRWATVFHCVFGVGMTATAAFATRSWEAGARFDVTEDALHGVASTVVGFAFAMGVLAVGFRRDADRRRKRFLDVVAIAASVVLPVSMAIWGEADGVFQRTMFLVAYLWYAVEAVELKLRHQRLEGKGSQA